MKLFVHYESYSIYHFIESYKSTLSTIVSSFMMMMTFNLSTTPFLNNHLFGKYSSCFPQNESITTVNQVF